MTEHDDLMPIGMFSRATLLSVKALRSYHELGLLVPTRIDPGTGYRSYAVSQLPDAEAIRRLRDLDVLLAATLNFGFFLGDIADPRVHNVNELYAAVVVNLIATILKFGDRTQIGAIHLATSLVALIQLMAAAGYHVWASQHGHADDIHTISSVVSLSGGALLANVVSVVLLVTETVSYRRR